MTNAQRILFNYLTSRGILGSEISFVNDERAEVSGRFFTVNIYGDIMDSKGNIIAEADVEHNLCSLGTKLPTSWTDR